MKVLTRGPRTVGGPDVRVLPVSKAMFSPDATEAKEENDDDETIIINISSSVLFGMASMLVVAGMYLSLRAIFYHLSPLHVRKGAKQKEEGGTKQTFCFGVFVTSTL